MTVNLKLIFQFWVDTIGLEHVAAYYIWQDVPPWTLLAMSIS